MSEFVHLHLHSEYSLLDGACRIASLAGAVKNAGQNAVAITDHGVMYGVVEFYNELKKNNIKPIIGCEVYVAPRSRFDKVYGIDSDLEHLVLLCKNEEGYKNLIKLVSLSFIEGFYSKPRVDLELLTEYNKGLIALSGCLSGALCKRILQNDFDGAVNEAKKYNDIFGAENYYIEIQNHGISDQLIVLPQLVNISNMTGIPLVATNDTHYLKSEDQQMQKVLMCIKMNKTVFDDSSLEFSSNQFYLKSNEEMTELFGKYEGAIENTVKIAKRCNLDFEFGKNKLPEFKIEGVTDNSKYFKKMCYDGLYEKYGENPEEDVIKRLEYELSVINKMGYVDYYLVVFDFVSFARKNGIAVGPGRGSGAGSLAAYCIGITGIDPIKYGLLFERFLNPERVSMPDFDIDFCYVRRQEVIDYVVQKYGSERVAQIITFGTMAARGAIRDVGRALDVSYAKVDEVAKLIPNTLHMTIKKAIELSPELKEMYENDTQITELIDMAQKVEGMPRHGSIHASGVVITKEPVSNYVPLAKSDESVITQFSMNDIAKLGLLKFDLLGLRTLTVIADTVKRIPSLNIESIDTEDESVYELFSKGQTEGIFQFESSGMKNMLMQLKPENLEDITAAESLYRPGPMKYIPEYIKNRLNPSAIKYKTPLLKPILNVTYGCLVYQEQVMQVFRELAGYSYGRSDVVRRAMAKKNHAVLEKERNNFLYGYKNEDGTVGCVGAVKNGVNEGVASELFNEMMSFADYAYNKSHAASYALIAYQTAWLKKYYKNEFMAALLTSVLDNTPKVARYIAECRRLNIKIIAPDVNISEEGFSINENSVVFGLLGVKNLGTAMIVNIIKERNINGKYTSFYNFCKRIYNKDFNRRALESLIKCGALDSLHANRRQMLQSSTEIIDALEQEKKGNIEGQLGFFGTMENTENAGGFVLPNVEEFPQDKLLENEKETVGIYISGHPLSKYESLVNNLKTVRISDLYDVDEENSQYKDDDDINAFCIINKMRLKSTKNDKSMAYMTVEDLYGSIEVIVFPKTLLQYSHMLKEGNIIYFSGRLTLREDKEPQIICQSVTDIDGAKQFSVNIKKTENKIENTSSENKRSKYYGLHLLLPDEDGEKTKRITAMLSIFDGNFPVYFKYESSGKRVLLPRKMWIEPNNVLISELRKILGDDNLCILD